MRKPLAVNPMYFHSQAMGSDGGAFAELAAEVIKDAALPHRHVLLREALQNSCDQRLSLNEPIDFYVDAFSLKGEKFDFLKVLLSEAGKNSDYIGYKKLAAQKEIEILAFADCGTKGLGGPTDASLTNAGNFVNFFFIFGRAADRGDTDGGAFGAGRTTLNNASAISSVLVYSRFTENGKNRSRLMGLANARSFDNEGKRFTGRHWWGEYKNERIQPREDFEADRTAQALGMDKYLKSSTGFVAFILGNVYIEQEVSESTTEARKELVEDLQKAAYLYGWPHMLRRDGKESVRFHFTHDGIELKNENPKSIGNIANFVESYEAILELRNNREPAQEINSKEIFFSGDNNSKSRTGFLAWRHGVVKDVDRLSDKQGEIPLASVALIRNAGFVVKYEKVAQFADNHVTRGVFFAEVAYEKEFRSAEPVAHDDWKPERLGLPKGSRNIIKQTKDAIQSYFKPVNAIYGGIGDGEPATIVANVIGAVVGGLAQTGPIKPKILPPGGGNPKRGFSIQQTSDPILVGKTEKVYQARFTYSLNFSPNFMEGLLLSFQGKAVIEGGSMESSPPKGDYVPKISKIYLNGNPVFEGTQGKDQQSLIVSQKNDGNIQLIEVVVECQHGLAVACKYEAKQVNK